MKNTKENISQYLKTIIVGTLEVNCYVLTIKGKTFIIDPGAEPENIISFLGKNSLSPIQILLTHAHADHISGVKKISDKYRIPVYLNEKDIILYKNPLNAIEPFYPASKELAPTVNKVEDDSIEVIHTPGHTPGGTCFYVKMYGILFSGDTIFQDAVGRTDLPGSSHSQLIEGIKTRILTLPEDTIIYPGHGPSTTVKEEKPHFLHSL